ncbi:MAG: haloacid dehalogenase type II, partial [Sulfolobales archaeon]
MQKRRIVLGFDLFGTILDTSSVLQEFRRKQLEYTWLLTLMGRYLEFEEITKRALIYVLKSRNEEEKFNEEIDKWNNLPAYPDAIYLKDIASEAEIYILSNGSEKEVRSHLARNGLLQYFKGIFSAERVKEYKPSPKVYKGFLDYVNVKDAEVFLVSSNPFDVIGAKNAGLGGIYVNR